MHIYIYILNKILIKYFHLNNFKALLHMFNVCTTLRTTTTCVRLV